MNKKEYLLTLLIEECAEVQKLCTKAQRFGLEDTEPTDHISNAENIVHELCDIAASVSLLVQDGHLTFPELGKVNEMIEAKKVRTQQWMQYSRNRGNLCD